MAFAREQPYENFGDWLLDQAERDDPVRDLARANVEELDDLPERVARNERSPVVDAFLEARREFSDYRLHLLRDRQLRQVEKFVCLLLERVHAETDCGRDGKHWPHCDAFSYMFGWKSWDEWATIGAALLDDA